MLLAARTNNLALGFQRNWSVDFGLSLREVYDSEIPAGLKLISRFLVWPRDDGAPCRPGRRAGLSHLMIAAASWPLRQRP